MAKWLTCHGEILMQLRVIKTSPKNILDFHSRYDRCMHACTHALRMILTGIHFVFFSALNQLKNNFDTILLQLNLPVPRLDHLACPSFEATNGP